MGTRTRSRGFIYFLGCGGIPKVKIGWSQRPEKRLHTFSAWCPLELKLLAFVDGTPSDEKRLHTMFAEDWSHCEWFRLSERLSAFIETILATGKMPPSYNRRARAVLPPWRMEAIRRRDNGRGAPRFR